MSEISDDEIAKLRHQQYLAERKMSIESEGQSAAQFDKAVLTLAAGAFGLSLAFLKDIAPSPDRCSIVLLGFTWLFFSVSMACTLVSLLTSQAQARRQRDINDEAHEKRFDPRTVDNPIAGVTAKLNHTSMVAFLAGVVLLGTFALLNVGKPEEPPMTKDKGKSSEKSKGRPFFEGLEGTKPAANLGGVQGTQAAKPDVPAGAILGGDYEIFRGTEVFKPGVDLGTILKPSVDLDAIPGGNEVPNAPVDPSIIQRPAKSQPAEAPADPGGASDSSE